MPELPYAGAALFDLRAAALAFDLGGFRAVVVDWGFYPLEAWRNYWHSHSYFEVCHGYSGSGVFRTGEREIDVGAGSLFVARPGDVHEIVSSAADPLGIQFWGFTLRPSGSPAAETDDVFTAFADPAAPVVTTAAAGVPHLLALLSVAADRRGPGSGEVVSALARLLLRETAVALAGPTAPSDPGGPVDTDQLTVATMRRYLGDNLARPVLVRDVAAQVHLSERHAGRLFRATTGQSVHAYLVRARLAAAAQLLAEAELPLKEIARRCGFTDVRHFITTFRKHHGLTPTEFRRSQATIHHP